MTYTQTYNVENRLASVTVNGQMTQFIYDGDGNLVKKVKPDGSRTIYVAGVYEVDKNSGGTVTRSLTYYPAVGAMRIDSSVYYIAKDLIGSASLVMNSTGTVSGEQRYYPFGETRFSSGSMLTDRLFTGQREISGLGIYDFHARFYSPKLGKFIQPDTVIPGMENPQNLNRFAYVLNNPIRYNDPTGHKCVPENECKGFKNSGSTPSTIDWSGLVTRRYGVTLSGEWSRENSYRVYMSLYSIDVKLAGGKLSKVTAGSTYLFQNNSVHYGGVTNNDTGDITFWSFKTVSPYQNIYHEVAHSIDVRTGEFFTNRLRSKQVFTVAGQFVMGGPDRYSKPAGIYSRNSLGYAETSFADPPFPNKIKAEQHPAKDGGNDANEEFGDLVANYVSDNFATDPMMLGEFPYGIARQNWVQTAFSDYFSNLMP